MDRRISELYRFGFCSYLHIFRGRLILGVPQNRAISSSFYGISWMSSDWPERLLCCTYKYTEDTIENRRSLCGLASQGSHYPHAQGVTTLFVGLSSTNYVLHPTASTVKEFNRPHGKRWAPKHFLTNRKRTFLVPVLDFFDLIFRPIVRVWNRINITINFFGI